MYAKVKSLGIFGFETFLVEVEADISSGLPRFDIVGLPDAAVKESKERVRSSIKNCKFTYPTARITVNIAPADIKKEGAIYDLPIFISTLLASGQLNIKDIDEYAFIGEMSLDGEIRPVKAVLPMIVEAKKQGIKNVFIPKSNELEGGVIDEICVLPVENIYQVCNHLKGIDKITPAKTVTTEQNDESVLLDFSDVKGQENAKRALEIAAAGGHNCIMYGPPGTGKSMLAKRMPSILPDMTFEEQIECTKLYSVAGKLDNKTGLITKRPFRSPHHTVSAQGLTGGGTSLTPGELSLAHNGVIFLDEFPEFDRRAKESLRQPLEDGIVTITRTSGTVTYPSNILLIAAMNPCPCGYLGHPTKECTCSDAVKSRYKEKISGPILDRIDIHIEVAPVAFDELSSTKKEESSKEIKKRVDKAREIQRKRFENTLVSCNAKMTPQMTKDFCKLNNDAAQLLKDAFEKLSMSARAYDKILRISRTIADLEESESIEINHIAEALQYRGLDRQYNYCE